MSDEPPRQIFTSAKRRRRPSTDVPLYALLLLALVVSIAIAGLLVLG